MATRHYGSAWNIEFSTPPTETRNWRQNKGALVIAGSAIRAAAMIESEWPGAQINSVHKANNNERFVLLDDTGMDINSDSAKGNNGTIA